MCNFSLTFYHISALRALCVPYSRFRVVQGTSRLVHTFPIFFLSSGIVLGLCAVFPTSLFPSILKSVCNVTCASVVSRWRLDKPHRFNNLLVSETNRKVLFCPRLFLEFLQLLFLLFAQRKSRIMSCIRARFVNPIDRNFRDFCDSVSC